MREVAKTFAGALGVIGLWAVSSTASAILCIGNVATLTQWQTQGAAGCTEGDKLYKYIGGTLITDPTIGSQTVAFNGGNDPNDIHQILVGSVIYASGDANANWTLDYSIQVTDLNRFLASVNLDVTQSQNQGSDTVTKEVRDSGGTLLTTLTSTNGVPSAVFNFGPGVQFVSIHEVFSKTGNATVNTAQNTYTENLVSVPEPATLALVGLGLLGLAARRRKS